MLEVIAIAVCIRWSETSEWKCRPDLKVQFQSVERCEQYLKLPDDGISSTSKLICVRVHQPVTTWEPVK